MKRELVLLMNLTLNARERRLPKEERELSQRLAEVLVERLEAEVDAKDRLSTAFSPVNSYMKQP